MGSSAIAWYSKKQDVTSLSSAEAKYIKATSAGSQGVWLPRLLGDIGVKHDCATILYCDNKSTIYIARNPSIHGRTKHIDTRYHFIRELVNEGVIQLIHCSTNEKATNILTKALPILKHEYFSDLLGVRSF